MALFTSSSSVFQAYNKKFYCAAGFFRLLCIVLSGVHISSCNSGGLGYYLDKLRTDVTSPSLGCGETRDVSVYQAVFIESPNFSKRKKYPNSITCKWSFHLHKCTLAISCPNFSLNKFLCFDYLDVSDGLGRSKRFCGSDGPQSLYMEGNVSVTFRSSPSFSGTGFRCFAVCVEPGPVAHTELAAPSIPFTSLGQCVCGRGNRDRKFAVREKFPWIAKLFRRSDHQLFCTATLISNQYLVSASHCFASSDTNDPSEVYVVLNDEDDGSGGGRSSLTDLTSGGGGEIGPTAAAAAGRRSVTSIIRYQSHGLTFEVDPDVALIKLNDTVNMDDSTKDKNSRIRPVCLPKGDELAKQFIGVDTISSQWEWDSQWQGHHLWNIKTSVISNENCSSLYKNTGRFRGLSVVVAGEEDHGSNRRMTTTTTSSSPTTIFCAQSKPSMYGSFCRPISGAALMTAENKGRFSKFTQIGVGTWGHGCGQQQRRQNMPQMYTRLTEIMSWILATTQDSAFCKG